MDNIPQNQVLMSCTGCGLIMLTFTHLLQIFCLCLPPCLHTVDHIALPSSHCTDRSCHCLFCTLESQRYVAILMLLQPNLSVLSDSSNVRTYRMKVCALSQQCAKSLYYSRVQSTGGELLPQTLQLPPPPPNFFFPNCNFKLWHRVSPCQPVNTDE